jgi:hypothetical protein
MDETPAVHLNQTRCFGAIITFREQQTLYHQRCEELDDCEVGMRGQIQ